MWRNIFGTKRFYTSQFYILTYLSNKQYTLAVEEQSSYNS